MTNKVVAPCGIACFDCELFIDYPSEVVRERVAKNMNIPKEKLYCKGCTDGNQCTLFDLQGKNCKTLECVNNKEVEYCFQCDDFPCAYLMPLADGAERFPQNIKLYNLCQMKKLGVEEWIKSAPEIKKTYFTKKMEIGKGGSNE